MVLNLKLGLGLGLQLGHEKTKAKYNSSGKLIATTLPIIKQRIP